MCILAQVNLPPYLRCCCHTVLLLFKYFTGVSFLSIIPSYTARKKAIYSTVIHSVLLLVMWWIVIRADLESGLQIRLLLTT